ncbi:TPA: palindromic element RPE1 domain-containing protein [Legionella feeleii]
MQSRLLAKLAAVRAARGETARRTAVYTPVHEDSSTGSTKRCPNAVEFQKKSARLALQSSHGDNHCFIKFN